jgi:PAS domain S-box-containing protein
MRDMNQSKPDRLRRRSLGGFLLGPAIAVMNRLTYPRKLALVGLVFAIPLGLFLYLLVGELNDRIQFTQKAIHGVQFLRQLRSLLEHTTASRLLARRYIVARASGGPDLEKLHNQLGSMQDHLGMDREKLLQEQGRLGEELETGLPVHDLAEMQRKLQANVMTLTAAQSDDQHQALAQKTRALMTHVGETSNLVLDPNLESYYLIDALLLRWPECEQITGEMALLLSGGKLNDPATRVEIIQFKGRLDTNIKAMQASLTKAQRDGKSPERAKAVQSHLNLLKAADAFLGQLDKLLLPESKSEEGKAAVELADTMRLLTLERDASFAFWDTVAADAEGVLVVHRDGYLERRNGILIVATVGALLASYLLGGFYAGVMGTVRGLEAAGRKLAEGAVEAPAVPARDELAQVITSFNLVAGRLREEWAQARDESARATAAEALARDREAQTRQIVETALDACLAMNEQGRIVGWNSQAEALFGWSQAEALGKQLSTLIIPPKYRDQHEQGLKRFLAEGVGAVLGRRLELTALRRDGSEFPIELSIGIPVKFSSGHLFHAFLRDISDRKRVEAERLQAESALRRAKEAAEEASRAKSQFLANMSHEIRTPLNAVIGMTSLLLDTALNDEQRQFALVSRTSSEALLSILNDILDFSKIEAGQLELEQQPFDLRLCVEEAIDLIAVSAGQKEIELAYDLAADVPAVIVGDMTRLRQVLTNLLGNAVKFTHKGEITVAVAARPIGGRHEVQFAVRDTGIGIPREKLDRLFRPFSQVDASTTRQYGGTGLGLVISKRLAELMGGRLWVESTPGVGSTFYVAINVPAAATRPRTRTMDMAALGKRALIVEDNLTNRQLLRRQLEASGLSVNETGSSREALVWAEKGKRWDLAFIDIVLPEIDGVELARRLRQLEAMRTVPLIAFTSVTRRDAYAQSGDFAAFLSKPLKPARLREILNLVLSGRPLQRGAKLGTAEFDETLGQRLPLRILIAEDVAVNQQMLRMMLKRLGYQADVAGNGLEALQALERQKYDLVLMDVQMPEMDGLECSQQILKRYEGSRPRIVALTANATQQDADQCRAAGMDDFLSKPVRVAELCRCLERWGQEHRTHEQHPVAPQPTNGAAGPASSDEASRLLDMTILAELRQLEQDGEPGLLRELLEVFQAQVPEEVACLRAAVEAGDTSALKSVAHRLKGTAATVGARAVALRCRDLEIMGRSGAVNGALELLQQLEDEYQRTLPLLLRESGSPA